MPDAAMDIKEHDQLIREVFIDPIRTVIVVDDEYPTLDSLLSEKEFEENGWKGKFPEVKRVRELLDFARTKEKPWLVDVHDGKKFTYKAEEIIAPYLHHSDLLVLDYNLDPFGVKGKDAINILRRLAENDHFNSVIVYTNEDIINKVVREIALGLTSPDSTLSTAESKPLLDTLEKWEEKEEGITSKLEDEVTEETYLQVRTKYSGNYDKILSMEGEGKRIRDHWSRLNKDNPLDPKQLVKWLAFRRQEKIKAQLSLKSIGNIQVCNSTENNWIQTGSLFITVLSKRSSPAQFETVLLEAIKASFPSPHRLLLAKIRSEIDQRGVLAEAAILENKYLQVQWLGDFLNPDPTDIKGVILNTIDRHWEALGDQMRVAVNNFAQKIHQAFLPLGVNGVMDKCSLNKDDLGSDESLKRFNCFTSTKPIDRSHLTTGHIFQMYSVVGGEPRMWICLSPACDLVPNQKTHTYLNESVPFIAARLHKVSPKKALDDANRNVFLFLDMDGKVETFCIHKEGNIILNPEWEQMFAHNQGRFHNENKLTIALIVEKCGDLISCWNEATLVAQLRSEYALNLLQRIGALLSRPGLGINFKSRLKQ